MRKKNPETPAEWQQAVDLAKVSLAIDAARKYGLVTGGPVVDVARCEEIIKLGSDSDFLRRQGNENSMCVV